MPSYAPGGSKPDPVLQTAMEMMRANREADAEPAGNLRQPGRTHTHMRLLLGKLILFHQEQAWKMGPRAGNPMRMDQVQIISNNATPTCGV